MTPVSVVIPAADAADAAEGLADAVASALEAGAAEVLIACDAGDDAVRAVAVQLAGTHPAVALVDNPGGTTSGGLNAAIAAARHDVIARLDAHTTIPPDYLQRACTTLARRHVAVVGGLQVATGQDAVSAAVADAMASVVGAGLARHRVGRREGPSETAYLGVFTRRWLEAVGGYQEGLRRNQDYEICHRIRALGGRVWFDPGLRVRYRPRGSWGALAAQYHEFGRWKRWVMTTAPGSIRPRQLAPPALVLALATSGALAAAGRRRASAIVPTAWAAALVAGAASARDGGMAHRVRVAAALAIMHLAWGSGVLRGGVHP